MTNTQQIIKLDLSSLLTETSAYSDNKYTSSALELLLNEEMDQSGAGLGSIFAKAVKGIGTKAAALGNRAASPIRNIGGQVANEAMGQAFQGTPAATQPSSSQPSRERRLSISGPRPVSPRPVSPRPGSPRPGSPRQSFSNPTQSQNYTQVQQPTNTQEPLTTETSDVGVGMVDTNHRLAVIEDGVAKNGTGIQHIIELLQELLNRLQPNQQ